LKMADLNDSSDAGVEANGTEAVEIRDTIHQVEVKTPVAQSPRHKFKQRGNSPLSLSYSPIISIF
jgi:hypothetical protein